MSAPRVRLLMAVHCHQPVGNFDFVFEEAFKKSYEPFLAVLERHPGVRLSLHYSGSLLDWLITHQPEFLTRVRALVSRGQVEMLASGYYEPILPMIPEADRQGQIALMRQVLQKRFGKPVTGLWMTERVWEPEMPKTLARAGIRYTMLDANQFASAKALLPRRLQVEDEGASDVLGCYRTEYEGELVTLFPASKRLRYSMPFQEVHRTIDFLKRLARDEVERPAAFDTSSPAGMAPARSPVAITFADDGEKFGFWPKTYEWVFAQGWLDQFFQAVERESSWLKADTFSSYLDEMGTQGQVALPCGSYEEMLEWSGGYFRNFLTKYPEANAMHQKMLAVSRRVQAIRPRAPRERRRPAAEALVAAAQQHLYMAQCNCAYWHGVFGGLYLGHLRRAVYANLITAERLLDGLSKPKPVAEADLDGDGRQEILLRSRALSVVVDPHEDGSVLEVDFFPKAANVTDTLMRRYEPYHEHLKKGTVTPAAEQGQAPSTIHDAPKVKEAGLDTLLVYDDHRRSNFRDYALSKMPTLQEIIRSSWAEHRLWSAGPWSLAPRSSRSVDRTTINLRREVPGGELRKALTLWQKAPRITFGYQVVDADVPVVALEFNLGFFDGRWTQPVWQDEQDRWSVADPSLGVEVVMQCDPAASLVLFPLETISGSEGGLERTPQGVACVCLWPTHGQRRWSGTVEWTVKELH
jgi:alpha-amylase